MNIARTALAVIVISMTTSACGQGQHELQAEIGKPETGQESRDNNRANVRVRIGPSHVRQAFLSGSVAEVHSDMSTILRQPMDIEVFSYLQGVWSLDPKVVSELDAEFVGSAPVRAYVANVLAQAVGSGDIKVDLASLRMALRTGLAVPDVQVKSRSVMGLSFIAEDQDIDRFAELAEGSNSGLAIDAFTALANACGAHAAKRLEQIRLHGSNPKVREIAESTISALQESTKMRCKNGTKLYF